MILKLLHRLWQAFVVVLVSIAITFAMSRLAPSNPFAKERVNTEEVEAQLQAQYGLDQPIYVQFYHYVKGLVHGDFGPSLKYPGRTVSEIISSAFPVSLQLGSISLLIALFVGIPAGIFAARRHNQAGDYVAMSASLAGVCMPTFVLGPLLAMIFGLKLKWFNVSGWYDPSDWILPAMTLGLYYAAYVSRLTRGGFLEVLHQDYIRTARAKGVSERQIIWKHAWRGALQPVISFLGPAAAGLLTGSFVVESIFQVPGLGTHFVNAAQNRDYNLLQGVVAVYAVLIVGFNLIVDLFQIWLNPRLRSA